MKPLLDALPKLPPNGLRVVSLFAGGGLLDLGVIHAGFEIVQAFEWELAPAIAYRHNIGDHLIGPRNRKENKKVGNLENVRIEDIADSAVIIGGPPCQDFSIAGSGAGEEGERGKLVWRYLEVIKAKRPKAFLFENVDGLTTASHFHTLLSLVSEFEKIGYSVAYELLCAWDYGVAQKRYRVFLVGIERSSTDAETEKLIDQLQDVSRKLAATKHHIERTKGNSLNKKHVKAYRKHQRTLMKHAGNLLHYLKYQHEQDKTFFQFPRSEYETSGYHPVLRDAIGDLPEPHGTALSDNAVAYLQRDPRPLEKHKPPTMNEPCSTVLANYAKGVPYGLFVPDTAHTVIPSIIVKGSTYDQRNRVAEWDRPARTVCTNRLDHAEIHPGADIANHGVGDYWTPKSEYSYDQANRVMSIDEPSNTIPAHHNSGQPIHPTQQPRRFTVRECLRIQSVPDTYILPKEISLSAGYKIVGNGVPSRLGYHLASALAAQIGSQSGANEKSVSLYCRDEKNTQKAIQEVYA